MWSIVPKEANLDIKPSHHVLPDAWTPQDRLSNIGGMGAGLILANLDGIMVEHALCFNFKPSKNEAEYKIPLDSLRLARELNVYHLQVFSDSQLVVS